jgi:hypothetical protein
MYAAGIGDALAVKTLLEGSADIGQVNKVRKIVDEMRKIKNCGVMGCVELEVMQGRTMTIDG